MMPWHVKMEPAECFAKSIKIVIVILFCVISVITIGIIQGLELHSESVILKKKVSPHCKLDLNLTNRHTT